MDAFDKFVVGDTESINWCFENTHFLRRLNENGLSREYIEHTVLYSEPLNYEKSGKDEYAVFFEAPANKTYKELKVIFACKGNSIDLVTIMPDTKYESNREQRKFQSDKKKKIDKMRNKAYSKKRF